MLSSKGTSVDLWVWEKVTGRLKQLTAQNVQYSAQRFVLPQWLSNQVLMCAVMNQAAHPIILDWSALTTNTLRDAWAKQQQGLEPTASALASGNQSKDIHPPGQLLKINVATGKGVVVGSGDIERWLVSPGGQYVAYTSISKRIQPSIDSKFRYPPPYKLQISSTNGMPVRSEVLETIDDVATNSITWAPDGRALAFIGRESVSTNSPLYLFRFDVATSKVTRPVGDKLNFGMVVSNVQPIIWTSADNVILRGSALDPNANSSVSVRDEIWSIAPDERLCNLTAGFQSIPSRLVKEPTGRSVIGVADGRLWNLGFCGEEPTRIGTDAGPRFSSILWPPEQTDEIGRPVNRIVVTGQDSQVFSLDIVTGTTTPIRKPDPEARFISFIDQEGIAIFQADTNRGSFLWSINTAGQSRVLTSLNTYLSEIADAHWQKILYRSTEGEELIAWLMLPVGYVRGTRYPLISYVYPGYVMENIIPLRSGTHLTNSTFINLQLLTAHGYAVLMPSMPLTSLGIASDPYLDLSKGVLPAIDRVIELGFADPERLGVMGHSYGGYGTYGLVTQTSRFRAAVSIAGFSNLLSAYGEFQGENRPYPYAHERTMPPYFETGQGRMGSPPWKDQARYLRNSPITYVDRIVTPILIIDGDRDIAIEQNEEFFTSLYRQGKRAEFVRYWGEGHLFDSPANIKDMWQRIFSWFDEFLMKPHK